MRVQVVVELLTEAGLGALQSAGHVVAGGEDPVVLVEVGVAGGGLGGGAARAEEGPQEQVGGGEGEQGVDEQGAAAGAGGREGEPALPQAQHGAGAEAAVVVGDGGDAGAGVPGVVGLPAAAEHGPVRPRPAPVPVRLPPLDAAAVHVRPQRERRVPRPPDPQPVRVRQRLRRRHLGRRIPRPPQPHQRPLRLEEPRVRPCLELRRCPVELVDLRVVLWKRCIKGGNLHLCLS